MGAMPQFQCGRCHAVVGAGARYCPSCGVLITAPAVAKRSRTLSLLLTLLGVLLIGYFLTGLIPDTTPGASSSGGVAGCTVSDISVTIHRVGFVDRCTVSPCIYLKGTATMQNRCTVPVGVEIEVTGYSKDGTPIATHRLWPFSVQNVPPGKNPFSLDQALDYDPAIKKFSVTPVSVHTWTR